MLYYSIGFNFNLFFNDLLKNKCIFNKLNFSFLNILFRKFEIFFCVVVVMFKF